MKYLTLRKTYVEIQNLQQSIFELENTIKETEKKTCIYNRVKEVKAMIQDKQLRIKNLKMLKLSTDSKNAKKVKVCIQIMRDAIEICNQEIDHLTNESKPDEHMLNIVLYKHVLTEKKEEVNKLIQEMKDLYDLDNTEKKMTALSQAIDEKRRESIASLWDEEDDAQAKRLIINDEFESLKSKLKYQTNKYNKYYKDLNYLIKVGIIKTIF